MIGTIVVERLIDALGIADIGKQSLRGKHRFASSGKRSSRSRSRMRRKITVSQRFTRRGEKRVAASANLQKRRERLIVGQQGQIRVGRVWRGRGRSPL